MLSHSLLTISQDTTSLYVLNSDARTGSDLPDKTISRSWCVGLSPSQSTQTISAPFPAIGV